MAVNGSVTPVVFESGPLTGEWDIVRMIGAIIDGTSMDDAKFGGIGPLTNGVVFRKKNGIYKNLFTAKSNGQMALRMYDVSYADKAPSGSFGLRFRRTWNGRDKSGVVVRLNAEDGDTFQCVIQDDLTGLDSFNVVIHGQVVLD